MVLLEHCTPSWGWLQGTWVRQPGNVPPFLSPLGSPRTRQRAGVCDLGEPARVLPQHHLRHHRQLRHFRAGGGPAGAGPAPPAEAQQPHDAAGAPAAAPCAAVPPGGPGPPPPLQRYLQRQQRHPVRGQPGRAERVRSGLPALLLRGPAGPKVCAGRETLGRPGREVVAPRGRVCVHTPGVPACSCKDPAVSDLYWIFAKQFTRIISLNPHSDSQSEVIFASVLQMRKLSFSVTHLRTNSYPSQFRSLLILGNATWTHVPNSGDPPATAEQCLRWRFDF